MICCSYEASGSAQPGNDPRQSPLHWTHVHVGPQPSSLFQRGAVSTLFHAVKSWPCKICCNAITWTAAWCYMLPAAAYDI
eukprot:6188302-Pleurochrysis_carterae.AAC.1